jgi:hypothetical protein
VLLALMMMNLLMIGGLLYVAKVQVDERHYIANQRDEMIKVILDRCQALK